ncbi:hypothetical protein [Candidatus Berkiella aquae]|uniref:Uncharacterized protein n=1 Tax=Candidatus Berkiella aquae TaxID=295108 RepID=A0A0Q9YDS4_9GAMM|nr:hypothetical protein [Candidatus Berkiella aquae]MCS5709951.1 hypothetical protein [Candidatus Berkiella aquae]
MNPFRNKGLIFGIAYSLAVFGWFSYTTLHGIDMLSFAKSGSSWSAKGYSHSLSHK